MAWPLRIRFSLKALFVAVGVCSLWPAVQARWIHERRAAVAWLEQTPVDEFDNKKGNCYHGFDARLPWSLRLLGESPVELIELRWHLFPEDAYTEDQLKSLFPEARIVVSAFSRALPPADAAKIKRIEAAMMKRMLKSGQRDLAPRKAAVAGPMTGVE